MNDVQISFCKKINFVQSLLKIQTLCTLNEKEKCLVATTKDSSALFKELESISKLVSSTISIPETLVSVFEERIKRDFASILVIKEPKRLTLTSPNKLELEKCEKEISDLLENRVKLEMDLTKEQIEFINSNINKLRRFGLLWVALLGRVWFLRM